MQLVDTHCHLVLLRERGLLDDALAGCVEGGISQVISVGLNVEDSEANRDIATAHNGVYFTVGWHPHEATAPDALQLAALAQLLDDPKAVAVGEIGLDLYFRPGYHETSLDTQLRAIHSMFELAEGSQKPVILHDRDAHNEILEVMRAHPRVRGVMHCFSGDALFADQCIALGYAVSFSGIVTFPRSESIQDAARRAHPDAVLIETDAPFLAPVPNRGKTNLPEYVAATAAKVAELRGISATDLAKLSSANAQRVFDLDGQRIGRSSAQL